MKWLRRFFAPAVRPCPPSPRRMRPTLEALEDRQVPTVLVAHARDPVVPPSLILPGIPPDLERVVLRWLN